MGGMDIGGKSRITSTIFILFLMVGLFPLVIIGYMGYETSKHPRKGRYSISWLRYLTDRVKRLKVLEKKSSGSWSILKDAQYYRSYKRFQ